MFITALWTQNGFTGLIERNWTLDNFRTLFTVDVYRTIALRTIGVALLVTVIDALVAFPIALYMSKVAGPGLRRFLLVAVLMPLWASYLVKAYAWRMLLSPEGPLSWAIGYTPGYGLAATVITLTYLWSPYMIIPVFAAFDRAHRFCDPAQRHPRRFRPAE